MKKLFILTTLFCLSFITYGQEKTFEVLENEAITLSDGVELYHNLYMPKNGSDFPAILIRTPYGKEDTASFASYFAKHGFVVLLQDVRGKGASKGVFTPFINEKKDGYETLDWIVKQSWNNGSIGLWGSSYLSYCALSLADSQHPALKSIFNLSGWIEGNKVNFPGGAMHQMLIIPWLLSNGQTSKVSESGADLDEIFAHTPLKEAIPGDGDIFTRSDGTKIYIDELESKFDYKNVAIPIFHMNGWYDFTSQSTIDAYTALNNKSKIEQYVLLGPWYHNQIYDEYDKIGDYKLPQKGQMSIESFLAFVTKWFEYTLKGNPFDMGLNNKVKYYVLFENEWRYSKQWPPKNIIKSLYLSKDRQLLSTKPIKKYSTSSFVYNPETPTPTLGGANFFLFADKIGIKNQQEIELRDDVLLFTTSKFKKDKVVAGNIIADLFVCTEGKSTDFTAKLTLVNRDGISNNIIDGVIRIQPEELLKGVTKITIELGDIAFKIYKGEKLRLQISSSNYPKLNRNPNTGVDPLEAINFIKVKQTVHHSKSYSSKINIPFLKN